LSYGITQCYLPPDRGDSHAFTPPAMPPAILPVLIYRPQKDEKLSRSGWLVIPRWFIHIWFSIRSTHLSLARTAD